MYPSKPSADEFDVRIARAKRKCSLQGIKVSFPKRIRKTQRLLVWYMGETVTFEYKDFIIDVGVYTECCGCVMRGGTVLVDFDASLGPVIFRKLLKEYFPGDAAVRTALSEFKAPARTKSKTVMLVDELPQAEVSVYSCEEERYICNFSMGPANRVTIVDAMEAAGQFRAIVDDYLQTGGRSSSSMHSASKGGCKGDN